MSPEFRLRPSLSGPEERTPRGVHAGVAGVQTPAFVERSWYLWVNAVGAQFGSVAGVQTPAFVERGTQSLSGTAVRGRAVSPEFRLRPSLSARTLHQGLGEGARVAGVQTPAFVERIGVVVTAHQFALGEVSPEFRLRPSLSGLRTDADTRSARGVAGVQTPAFVERARSTPSRRSRRRCRRSSDSGLR